MILSSGLISADAPKLLRIYVITLESFDDLSLRAPELVDPQCMAGRGTVQPE
jgi:hypothetical protein